MRVEPRIAPTVVEEPEAGRDPFVIGKVRELLQRRGRPARATRGRAGEGEALHPLEALAGPGPG